MLQRSVIAERKKLLDKTKLCRENNTEICDQGNITVKEDLAHTYF